MTDINLNRKEKKRLIELNDALNWRLPVSIKTHFNKVGKLETFMAAATPEEVGAQRDGLRGFLYKSDADSALSMMKATDIFLRIARRVGNDSELSALLPKNKFDAKDAELLEKLSLNSLAVLIRTKL